MMLAEFSAAYLRWRQDRDSGVRIAFRRWLAQQALDG